MIDVTPVIQFFFAVLAAFLTPRLMRWLKAGTGAEERAALREWAKIAVAAAEQLYRQGEGAKKKKYVTDFLSARGFALDFEELNNAVEAAVLELRRAGQSAG